nr:RagB/SusD family nutrient uptake outer membrane protein [uncultured Chryseobacterium sp.]
MKKYIKLITIIAVGFSLNSCTDDNLLDLTPINNIPVEEAYSTPALIESSMNGVYNAAALGQYNSTSSNGGRGYIWGAAFIPQGDTRGEDVVNTQAFFLFTYTNTYDTGTANNTYYWVDGYRLINRCNLMIEGVTDAAAKGIVNQSVADNYIGQAKFLRAITHFEMLMYFARPYQFTANASHPGIPYREVGINTAAEIESELLKGRNTVAECYDKIIRDLDDAEATITNTAKFKATRNASIAFKTRVYLHKRDWQNVINEGNKLNGVFTLTASPEDPFVVKQNFSNTESVFSVQQDAANNPGTNGAISSLYSARLLVCISPIIWRDPQWLADDKRRTDNSALDNAALRGTGLVFTSGGRKFTNKYKAIRDNAGGDPINTDAAPVIRYAEVVLNMAEAYARTNDLQNALINLNRVRNRSLADPAAQAYTSATLSSQNALVNAILKERRIEFLMEGRRWSDIHRLQEDDIAPINGIPAKVAAGNPPASAFVLGSAYDGPYGVAAVPASDYRFLWPIPQMETASNPTLAAQQNPGW